MLNTTKQLQEEQKGKYPYCEKPILNWLHDRIESHFLNNTERI